MLAYWATGPAVRSKNGRRIAFYATGLFTDVGSLQQSLNCMYKHKQTLSCITTKLLGDYRAAPGGWSLLKPCIPYLMHVHNTTVRNLPSPPPIAHFNPPPIKHIDTQQTSKRKAESTRKAKVNQTTARALIMVCVRFFVSASYFRTRPLGEKYKLHG
jgi:hypothetical protein